MAKKKKKAKLPKRIAGVKVPKALRKSQLGNMLASPIGQAILVEALVDAGELLIRKQAKPGSAVRSFARHPVETLKDGGREFVHLGEDAASGVAGGSAAFTEAVSAAAHAFVETMRRADGADRDDHDEDDDAPPPKSASKSKKGKGGSEARAH